MKRYNIKNSVKKRKDIDSELYEKYPYYIQLDNVVSMKRLDNFMFKNYQFLSRYDTNTLVESMEDYIPYPIEVDDNFTDGDFLELAYEAQSLGNLFAFELLMGFSHINDTLRHDVRDSIRVRSGMSNKLAMEDRYAAYDYDGILMSPLFDNFETNIGRNRDKKVRIGSEPKDKENASFDVVGNISKYYRGTDFTIRAVYAFLQKIKGVSIDTQVMKTITSDYNIDKQYFFSLKDASERDDYDKFKRIVLENLIPIGESSSLKGVTIRVAGNSKQHKYYVLPSIALRDTGFSDWMRNHTDESAMILLGNRRRTFSNLENREFITLNDKTVTDVVPVINGRKISNNKTHPTCDRFMVMFKDEETAIDFVENVYSLNKINPLTGLVCCGELKQSKKISIYHYKSDVVGGINDSKINTKMEVNKSARKTFFDKNTNETFLELKIPINTVKLAIEGVDISDHDKVKEYTQACSDYDHHGLGDILDILRDKNLGLDYNVYYGFYSRLANGYIRNTVINIESIVDERFTAHYENLNKLTFPFSDILRKNYMTHSSDVTLDKVGDTDALLETHYKRYKEFVNSVFFSSINDDTPFNNRVKQGYAIRRKVGYAMPCITIAVGVNSSKEELDAVRTMLKRMKVMQADVIKHCNIYPYLCPDGTVDELLKLIEYT